LIREHEVRVSLQTVKRAVTGHRRELAALARVTVRFETPPGRQLQIHFGEIDLSTNFVANQAVS